MKATPDENERIARQLERCAEIVRTTGPKAWQLAKDWSKSSLHAAGMDPGRGSGGHGDPTPDAALAEGYDSPGEQYAYLSAELGRVYDAAVTAGERVLNIARIAVAENERKGIGWCSCGRYCDGSGSNRLRSDLCPACDAKERRDRNACKHDSQITHNGVIHCKNPACAIELTPAGLPA